jgi:hypothetical protein
MQISATNLLQVAQQALAAKPAAPQQPATQTFEPMSFAPETASEAPAASATPARIVPPGSRVDIRV